MTFLLWIGESLRDAGIALRIHMLIINHVQPLVTLQRAEDEPALPTSLRRRSVRYFNQS